MPRAIGMYDREWTLAGRLDSCLRRSDGSGCRVGLRKGAI